jgi:FkbM family methyltransferase
MRSMENEREKDFSEKLYNIYKLYNNLYDEESRIVFKGRYISSVEQDKTKIFEYIRLLNKKYIIPELDDFLKSNLLDSNRIIVYGSGFDLDYTLWLLETCEIQAKFLINISEENMQKKYAIPTISLQELVINYRDYVVLIASEYNAFNIYKDLLYCKFPRNRILCPRRGILEGFWGNQYFDFLKHVSGKHEIFVDCGGYDGNTSIEFANWCHGEYDKIFIFEMDKFNIELCKKSIGNHGLNNCVLMEYGVWSDKEELRFDEGRFTSSSILDDGSEKRTVCDLDSVLGNENITFIKMDIEGAELEAIKGARNIIARYKPNLAISVYHRPEDIIEIPLLLWEIVPDYTFCLRHYRSSRRETVLYAFMGGTDQYE